MRDRSKGFPAHSTVFIGILVSPGGEEGGCPWGAGTSGLRVNKKKRRKVFPHDQVNRVIEMSKWVKICILLRKNLYIDVGTGEA
jgi:hypothetical protein